MLYIKYIYLFIYVCIIRLKRHINTKMAELEEEV